METSVVAVFSVHGNIGFLKGSCIIYGSDQSPDSLQVVYTHTSAFTGVIAFNDKVVAVADIDKSVLIINASDWKIIATHRIPKSPTGIALSSDGVYISDRFGDIHKDDQAVGGTVSTVTDLAVSNKQLFAADRDEKIRVFDCDSMDLDGFLLGHSLYVACLCEMGDDLLVSGGGDDYLCVWKTPVTGTVSQPEKKISISALGVQALRRYDERRVVVAFDNSTFLSLVNISDGVVVQIDCASVITSIGSKRECVVIGLADGNALVWSEHCAVKSVILPAVDRSVALGSLWKSKFRKNPLDHGYDEEDAEIDGDKRLKQ